MSGASGAARSAGAATRSAAGGVQRHRTLLRRVGKIGYLAYGLIHLLIAGLAVQVAIGSGGQSADATGAMGAVASKPFGKALLIVLTIGLAMLALWRLSQAIWGVAGESDRMETARRVASGCQTVAYGALAVSCAKVAVGSGSSASNQQQKATSHLLGIPGGQFLVGLVGVIVIGVGVGLAIFGLLRKFSDDLSLHELRPRTRTAVCTVGAVGYLAKGIAYGIVGVLLIVAAVNYDPERSRGLDAALRTLAEQPYGPVLLIGVAIGFACFGVYCFARARYQRR